MPDWRSTVKCAQRKVVVAAVGSAPCAAAQPSLAARPSQQKASQVACAKAEQAALIMLSALCRASASGAVLPRVQPSCSAAKAQRRRACVHLLHPVVHAFHLRVSKSNASTNTDNLSSKLRML